MTVIPYWPLGRDEFDQIARHRLQRVGAQYQHVYGASLTVSDEALSWIVARAEGVGHSGARAVHRVIDEQIVPLIARQVLASGGGQEHASDLWLGFRDGVEVIVEPLNPSTSLR
jgi:type VI secretion system protein VasG